MILFFSLLGYLFYIIGIFVVPIISKEKKRLTNQQERIVNVLIPGMGYYYNGKKIISYLYFVWFAVIAVLFFVCFYQNNGKYSEISLFPLLFILPIVVYELKLWRKQKNDLPLLRQIKKIEQQEKRKPIIGLDTNVLLNEQTRNDLTELYNQSNYEFAVANQVVEELQPRKKEHFINTPTILNQLKKMELEGRLQVVNHPIDSILQQLQLYNNDAKIIANYIADSQKRECFYIVFTGDLIVQTIPGITFLKYNRK